MAKAKFQDTLKNGLTGVATVGKRSWIRQETGLLQQSAKARNSLTRLTKERRSTFLAADG